jgi:hypothetical protein
MVSIRGYLQAQTQYHYLTIICFQITYLCHSHSLNLCSSMAQHYNHLCSDKANRGMAVLVKDCIFSAPVNIQISNHEFRYPNCIIRHADWVALCQSWGLRIDTCHLHGGVFHEHSALSWFECHSPVLHQPSLHSCSSVDLRMSFNTHPYNGEFDFLQAPPYWG